MPPKITHALSVINSKRGRGWCDRCQATVRTIPRGGVEGGVKCHGAVQKPLGHFMLTRDLEARTGVCVWCGPVLTTKNGRCLNANAMSAYNRRGDGGHGLSVAQARVMREGKLCDICGAPGQNVDHDHETGSVRGVLCTLCNRGLGHFDDDPDLLAQAVDYLIKHGKVRTT